MFVKTEGPVDAKIMLVGEAPGYEEDISGKPFVGKAGKLLDRLLNQTGISRHECLIANVARERPPGNKITFFFEDSKCTIPKPVMKGYIDYLKREIATLQPNIVIALGDTALWALTGEKGIKAYRGYILESTLVPGQKVLATYHPQKVNYEWSLAFPTVMDLRKGLINSNSRKLPKDNRVLVTTLSKREYIDYLNFLYKEHKGSIALDIETASPGAHIDIMGLADSPDHAVSFEFIKGRKPRFSPKEEHEVWHWLAKVCSEKELIMMNGSYDAAVLYHNHGIFCGHFNYDIMIAAHICWPESPRSLNFLTSLCLNVPPWKDTAQTFPTLYNAADAANTYGVWNVLSEELTKMNLQDIFSFEMSQVNPAMMMQLQGLYVDKEKLEELKADVSKRLPLLQERIDEAAGGSLNLNSPKHMKDFLYINLELPPQYKRRKSVTDTRKMTTDADALLKLYRNTKNETLAHIIEAKKLLSLQSKYLNMSISPESKVHTSYNVTGATMLKAKKGFVVDDEDSYKSFGRWSSSASIILPYGSGNLQNIPKLIRKIYTAPDGYEFVQGDYVQAEAVVVAYKIGDHKLIMMFKASRGLTSQERKARNLDVHKLTASLMHGIPIAEVTEEQRNKEGKILRHAISYHAGPGVVASKLGISMKEAKIRLQKYYEITPQLKLWHMRIQDQLRKTRTLTNLLGRTHKFQGRWGDDLFRSAYSFIPQSTVGDLLNKSLVKLYNLHGEELSIYLQLHDAIYVISEIEKRLETIKKMRECMLHPLEVDGVEFTIDVDFSVGKSWGELEDL